MRILTILMLTLLISCGKNTSQVWAPINAEAETNTLYLTSSNGINLFDHILNICNPGDGSSFEGFGTDSYHGSINKIRNCPLIIAIKSHGSEKVQIKWFPQFTGFTQESLLLTVDCPFSQNGALDCLIDMKVAPEVDYSSMIDYDFDSQDIFKPLKTKILISPDFGQFKYLIY